MRELKFRFYDYKISQEMIYQQSYEAKNVIFDKWETTPKCSPLMQYTGLRDKNGKKVYEGDILKCPDFYETPENTSMTYSNFKVTFENFAFHVGLQPMYEDYEWLSEECEVIGNIYQNPEIKTED